MSTLITDYARKLLSRRRPRLSLAPEPGEWKQRSGSGMLKPLVKVLCAHRNSGKAWLVKHRNQIVLEIRCDEDVNARANAHTFAQNLRRQLNHTPTP